MNELLLELQPHLISMAVTLLTALGAFLANKARKYINTKEKMEVIKSTVLYVEQIGKTLQAEEKFSLAKEKAIEWLAVKGIRVSEVELEILIERFVQEFLYHFEDEDMIEVDTSDEDAHLMDGEE